MSIFDSGAFNEDVFNQPPGSEYRPAVSGGLKFGGTPVVSFTGGAVIVLPGQVIGSGVLYRKSLERERPKPKPRPRTYRPGVGGGMELAGWPTVSFLFGVIPALYLPLVYGGIEFGGEVLQIHIISQKPVLRLGGSPRVRYFKSARVMRPSRLRVSRIVKLSNGTIRISEKRSGMRIVRVNSRHSETLDKLPH